MAKQDILTRFTDYLGKTRDYAASPSVMTGLSLDETSTRLRQLALTELKDVPLSRCLEQLRLAIGKQDASRINQLLEEMEDCLQNHA